MKSVERKQD